ncbi:MAG: hypothetical protein Aurels2KO_35080 [Aureliella sp.]
MDGWQAEWTIDSLDETRRRCLCSPSGSRDRFTHFGKLFTGSQPSREYDAFCRAATIGLTARHDGIPTPIGGKLDCGLPILVFQRREGMTLNEWLNLDTAPQPMFRRLDVASKIVAALQHVHRMGYIHGSVSADHVLVKPDDSIALVGWGSCEIVGAKLPPLNQHVHSLRQPSAPERSGTTQASSSEDIFALAYVLGELLGQSFMASPIARSLLSADPFQRPTTGEIAKLLNHFQSAISNTPDFGQSMPIAA